MAPLPDREAFLRRLEEQQKQAQQLKEQQQEQEQLRDQPQLHPQELEPPQELELKTASIPPEETATKPTAAAAATPSPTTTPPTSTTFAFKLEQENEEETREIKEQDNEMLQYFSEQCGMTDGKLLSLDEFDASSLHLLRQMTPRKATPLRAQSDVDIGVDLNVSGISGGSIWKELVTPEPEQRQEFEEENKEAVSKQDINFSSPSLSFTLPPINEIRTNLLRTVSGITIAEKSFSSRTGYNNPNDDDDDDDYDYNANSQDNYNDEINSTAAVASTANNIDSYSNMNRNVEWQAQLLKMLEQQNQILQTTRNRVESLEHQVQHLQSLLQHQTSTGIPTLSSSTQNQDNININDNNDPNDNNNNNRMGIGHKLKNMYKDTLQSIQNTRTYRTLQHAYNEAVRQNIHEQLDAQLFFKMIFFVVMFGGRNRDPHRTNGSFLETYRFHLFGLLAFFVYLLQTGILAFLYRFLTQDLKRLEARDEARAQAQAEQQQRQFHQHQQHGGGDGNGNGNGNGNEGRRVQRDRGRNGNLHQIMEEEEHANAHEHEQDHPGGEFQPLPQEQNNMEGGDPENADQPYFTDGGIDDKGGIIHDLKYLVGSFVLSLIPTWKPVKIDEEMEEELEQAQAEDFVEPLPQEQEQQQPMRQVEREQEEEGNGEVVVGGDGRQD